MSPHRRVGVLMINDSLNVGGAERVAVDIVNTLDRDRFDVAFCSTRIDGPLRPTIRDDVPVTILGRRATWDVGKLLGLARLVHDRGIDVIHSHGRGTMKFVSLAQQLGLVRARHVFHDHFGWLHVERGASWGLRRAIGTVDAYVGVDSRLCRWAETTAHVPADRIHLVRSGVDLARFDRATPVDLHAELCLPASAFVLLMVANFRPQKDHPTLYRAIAELDPELRRRLRLVVCGSTSADVEYHAACTAMAERLGIVDLIVEIGQRDDVVGLLAGADGAVLSSKNETGPLVVLEYMAAGVPFVATETGEITSAVRDLDVGFVPAPRDHLEVADALEALLTMSDEDRGAMGRRGRAAVEARFSQSQAVAGIEKVYEEVLGIRDPRMGPNSP